MNIANLSVNTAGTHDNFVVRMTIAYNSRFQIQNFRLKHSWLVVTGFLILALEFLFSDHVFR